MSERKVLNKYYPADFDPNNIPKMRQGKNRPFNIRLMAPCNMRCNTCGVYIYKGKKFNSRKEDVEDETYLGLRIFRFYIKCPSCVSEIAFKTDLKNTDYVLEAGATRLFEAEKLAKEMAERERQAIEDEELNNPMKVLENRTKASRNEIEAIDALEELREINTKKAAVDHEKMIQMHQEYEKQLQRLQEEEEEKEIRAIFGEKEGVSVKRLKDDSDSDSDEPKIKKHMTEKVTDILSLPSSQVQEKPDKKPEVWEKSVGGFGTKKSLKALVKKKVPDTSKHIDTVNSVRNEGKQTQTVESEKKSSLPSWQSISQSKNVSNKEQADKKTLQNGSISSGHSALGMLGSYSDSDSSNESN